MLLVSGTVDNFPNYWKVILELQQFLSLQMSLHYQIFIPYTS